MKVGTLVQVWHDTGALGTVPIYGVVTSESPKTFVVTWERCKTSRVRKSRPNGVQRVAPYNDDIARYLLRKYGLVP